MYLYLRRILCVVLKLEVSQSDLVVLDTNVKDFIWHFLRKFPDQSVTFKIHNMLPYKLFIERYGPIWLYCTLRIERMHQMMINMVKGSQNHTNSPKQIIRWYLIKKSIGHFTDKNNNFKEISITDQNLLNFVSLNAPIKELKAYTYNKIEFVKHHFYVISEDLENIAFARCARIYEENGLPKIIMQTYRTLRFDQLSLCYEIEPTDELNLANLANNWLHITLYTIIEIVNCNRIQIQKTF